MSATRLGSSNWSATQAGVRAKSGGTLDFSNAYNFFSGTGSYFLGFQAGYDYLTASHWLVRCRNRHFVSEFPRRQPDHLVATDRHGELSRTRSSFPATCCGRVGYAPVSAGHWLFYATGGLAFSYDQFTRTQLAGFRPAAPRCPARSRMRFWCRASAARSAPASKSRLASHWTAQLRISVHRLRQHERHVSGRRAALHFRSDAARIALRAELSLQRR